MLKTQQVFRSEKYNVSYEEFNKLALSLNDDKRKQLIYLIGTCAIWTSKNAIYTKEAINCSYIIK